MPVLISLIGPVMAAGYIIIMKLLFPELKPMDMFLLYFLDTIMIMLMQIIDRLYQKK